MKRTQTVKVTEVVKKVSTKIKAWENGTLYDFYVTDTHLHGSPAKRFIRNNGRLQVVVAKIYQDEQGRPYVTI